MFGLLGPNGAGKSTLMRTIATLQDADSGSVHLGDLDVLADKTEARRRLGYLPQEFGVYPKVSAMAMLDHFAILKGVVDGRQRKELVKALRSEEHTSELQSLMRISYAVFCLKKKITKRKDNTKHIANTTHQNRT